MNCLPPVTIPSGTYFLPLSPGAASLLSQCVLASERLTLAEIADLLQRDPALAIWLMLSSQANRPPETLRELALSCLTTNFVDRLVWDERCHGWQWHEEWDAVSCARQAAIALQRIAPLPSQARVDSSTALVRLVADAQLWLRKSDNDGDVAFLDLPGRLQFKIGKPGAVNSLQADANPATQAECRKHWISTDQTLVEMLPQLAEQARSLRNLRHSFDEQLEEEKLNAMKELAYGASHEINNPLANIATRAQTLLIDETDPKRQRALAAINRQSFRAHEMIADLMLFAKPPRLEMATVCPGSLLEMIAEEFLPIAVEQNCHLSISIDEHCPSLRADPIQLSVVLRALVRNSLEALAGQGTGGRVQLAAEPAADGHFILLSVTDDGPGIPEEIRSHLFDPFYSGREAGRGLGFGMAKAWRIVGEHGGSLKIDETSANDGTQVTVRLPLQKCA